MPFRYRLQKVLDFRIRKKDEQQQAVQKAKEEVARRQQLIDDNKKEISGVIQTMHTTKDFRMMDNYDKYLKHLYEKEVQLIEEKNEAIQALKVEEQKLIEREKEVKVLEKHKDKCKETYYEEERQIENKQMSEIAVQKYFQRQVKEREEAEINELQELQGDN